MEYSFIFGDYKNWLDVYKERVADFEMEQENYSWLSWNLPDDRTLQYYNEHGKDIYLIKNRNIDSLKNKIKEKNGHIEVVPRRENEPKIEETPKTEESPKTGENPKLDAVPEKDKKSGQR